MRLFCSGSAPLSPETFDAFRELTGHTILERYGMTETGMNLSNPYAGVRRAGTVGMPLPGVGMRIVNPDGHVVANGEEGEILVRGSNVFAGLLECAGEDGRQLHARRIGAPVVPHGGHCTTGSVDRACDTAGAAT